jgi:hypothetical protein
MLLLSHFGFEIFKIQGKRMDSESAFYAEFGQALGIETPLSNDMYALADVVGDLPVRPGHRKAILWEEADKVLERLPLLMINSVNTILATSESAPPGQLDLYLLGSTAGYQTLHWPSEKGVESRPSGK